MKRIALLTSGGDSPGMNAAVRAVVRSGIYKGLEVYGIKRGYEGLIEGTIDEMSLSSVADIIHRGGTVLRSARSKYFMTDEGFEKGLQQLKDKGIEGLIVIGGDGSMAGACKIAKFGVPTIALPGTIDNDLGYTDFTIGFDTAVNTVLGAIGNIRDTSSSHGRVIIIEVMGRNCGDIALYAGIGGGAESILVPEIDENIDEVFERIVHGNERGKLHSIILLAEGAKIKSHELVKLIEDKIHIETRVSTLGYIQRGGTPSSADRMLASRLGVRAVELLMEGMMARAVGIRGNEIIDMDIEEALSYKRMPDIKLYEMAKILSI